MSHITYNKSKRYTQWDMHPYTAPYVVISIIVKNCKRGSIVCWCLEVKPTRQVALIQSLVNIKHGTIKRWFKCGCIDPWKVATSSQCNCRVYKQVELEPHTMTSHTPSMILLKCFFYCKKRCSTTTKLVESLNWPLFHIGCSVGIRVKSQLHISGKGH